MNKSNGLINNWNRLINLVKMLKNTNIQNSMILLKSEVTHGYEEVVVLVIELNLREFLSDLSCLLDKIEIFFINGGILTVELGFLLTESLVLQVELIPALIVAALVYITAEIDDNVI